MTTKCTGLMGRIFGHHWREITWSTPSGRTSFIKYTECSRCGAIKGVKDEQ